MSKPTGIATAIILTGVAIVLNSLAMGPAVILLNVGLIAAPFAWLTTGSGRREPPRLVGPIYLASIVIQTLHFVEEYRGRLYEILPPLFDLEPLQPHPD